MAASHGAAGQFGLKTETTVGTAITVDDFLPILSAAVKSEQSRLDSQGIRAGRLTKHAWKKGQTLNAGTVEMELWNVDVAPLFKHLFGAVSTAGSGPYTHTYTPGVLTGDSFTCQVGIPDISGTVNAFTYAGSKVNQWTIRAEIDQIATLSLDLVAMTQVTNTALASASYSSSLAPFVFTEASVTVGGSAVNTVKSVELMGNNGLTERVRLGAATSREYLENAVREYSGTLVMDFESLTEYNRYIAASEFAVVLAFNNGTQTLTFTMNCRYNGENPELGPELVEQSLPFECVHATADASAITAVLVNTDASAA